MISISLIVPVYNVASYIEACFHSITRQTHTQGVECLFIDDRGTDDSITILERLVENYVGPICFRIIHREKNGGLSAARNTGIFEARGDYLYFLDSDDTITPDCLERMITIVNVHPHVQLVQGGASTNKGHAYKHLSLQSQQSLPDYSEDKRWNKTWILYSKATQTAWNKLVKRSWILKNNLFFREGIYHEDDLWRFYYAKYVDCLGICKHDTYNYILREGSIITNHALEQKRWESLVLLYTECIDNIDRFCLKQQVWMVTKKLVYITRFCPIDKYKLNALVLLMKLLIKASFLSLST